jgi:hypothetical protein
MPASAAFFSSTSKRCFIEAKLCRSQMERTPEGETNTPCLRNSLLARTWPGELIDALEEEVRK